VVVPNFKKDLEREKRSVAFLETKMPYISFEKSDVFKKQHDAYYGGNSLELKFEEYSLENERVFYSDFYDNKKITSNLFLEIFSSYGGYKLGGAAQTHFKSLEGSKSFSSHEMMYGHFFMSNGLLYLMRNQDVYRFILKSIKENSLGSVRPVHNPKEGYTTYGVPVPIKDIVQSIPAVKFLISEGAKSFHEKFVWLQNNPTLPEINLTENQVKFLFRDKVKKDIEPRSYTNVSPFVEDLSFL